MFNPLRIKKINHKGIKEEKECAYYWMQASQRIEDNFAFEYLLNLAERYEKYPCVLFCLAKSYPGANRRHYYFMLQGILKIKERLKSLGIEFKIVLGNPEDIIKTLSNCALMVCDKGYVRIQRLWREEVSRIIDTALFEVEDNVVIPVEQASEKEEYGAYTIRRKLWDKKNIFFEEKFQENEIKKYNKSSAKFLIPGEIESNDIEEILSFIKFDDIVKESFYFCGGEDEAIKKMNTFIEDKIDLYEKIGNVPGASNESELSPYLHFGQISPVRIMRELKKTQKCDSFVEQLFIRRELAINYVWYNENYDNYNGLKNNWIYETFSLHSFDKREYLYGLNELEKGETHDKYWNAAQLEMCNIGKMNSYMRMYWGKKIIEWSISPEEAMKTMIYLNDKYSLDGRDPNGYAGIAWCFGKHDRAWKERNIFGKVRYMNSSGLERKFDMKVYLEIVEEHIKKNEKRRLENKRGDFYGR